MRLLRFLPRRWWRLSSWKSWFSYIRWRLETYGVYHPAGKLNWKYLWITLRNFPRYYHWIGEMDALKKRKYD